MLKIGVLVSGGGTNLQALIDAEKDGNIKNGRISLVVSSKPGVYALERAAQNGIQTQVVERRSFSDVEKFSGALTDAMQAHEIDLVVLAGFLTITSDSFVAAFQNRIINVHPALIPAFSGKGFYGLHVHEAALQRGVKLTGATVHFVNEICDGGPIILQQAVAVNQSDTPETLQKRVMEEAEWKLLPKAVSLFCEGRLQVKGNRVHIANAE